VKCLRRPWAWTSFGMNRKWMRFGTWIVRNPYTSGSLRSVTRECLLLYSSHHYHYIITITMINYSLLSTAPQHGCQTWYLVLAETFLLILFVPTSNYLSQVLHLLACGMDPLSAFNFSEHKFCQYKIHFGLILF
jgi:hypothetical protein